MAQNHFQMSASNAMANGGANSANQSAAAAGGGGGGGGQQQTQSSTVGASPAVIGGGRFDFDDGGTYCGGWHDGKAHGHGICTGPKGQGEYSGSWHYGFEVSGIYKWPSGATYEGQWQNGKRHGIGVEYRGKWVYKGEWTQGYKGRYGIRASLLSTARYEGTWANGLQDGYGSETYADGGTYQGQWLRGMRHGYGVRTSAQYGHSTITKIANSQQNNNLNPNSSLQSLDTEGEDPQQAEHRDAVRGGFVLVARVSPNQIAAAASQSKRRNSLVEKSTSNSSLTGGFLRGLRLRKQRSTGDLDMRNTRNQKSMTPSLRSSREGSETGSTGSVKGDLRASQAELGSNASFLTQNGDISDPSTVETYYGEWKNDKRCGFGICERTDGLRYEGEWYNNKKYGYGVTTFPDGTREEGKYKNNQLVTNIRKKHLFMMRSSKLRERIESAVVAAARAQQIALQKSDIAASRTATARAKSEQADYAASTAQNDSQMALIIAKQYGGGNLANQQGSIAPLRRRLSDFSQVRRMRADGGPNNDFDPQTDHNTNQAQNPNSRQFLDPNEPFGGRRGSFRTGQNNQSQQMLTNTDGGGGGGSQLYAQHYPQQHMAGPPHPYGGYPPGGGGGGGPFGGPQRYLYQPTPGIRGGVDPKDPFSQAFSDHFDHYQKQRQRDGMPNSNFARYQSPSNSSRIPTPSGYSNSQMANSSMSPSPVPSQYSTITPGSSAQQSQITMPHSLSPSPISNIGAKPPFPDGGANHYPPRPPPPISSSSTASQFAQIPSMKPRQRMMMMNTGGNPNAINYAVDESSEFGGGGFGGGGRMNMNKQQEDGVRHLRTASLYRPGTQQPNATSGGNHLTVDSGGGSGGFKRKPSLQPNVARQVNRPLMSREEASALSHQQREQRRVEQEYRERLSRNPLLYLWSPNLIAWLNRQKLVILVFIINICIAYLFIRMIL